MTTLGEVWLSCSDVTQGSFGAGQEVVFSRRSSRQGMVSGSERRFREADPGKEEEEVGGRRKIVEIIRVGEIKCDTRQTMSSSCIKQSKLLKKILLIIPDGNC